MKKLITALCACLLSGCMLAAVGCNSQMDGKEKVDGKTTYQAYEISKDTLSKELKNFEYSIVQIQTISAEGFSYTLTATENGKRYNDDIYAGTTYFSTLGQSSSGTLYYVDNVLYVVSGTTRAKANVPLEAFVKYIRDDTDATIDDYFGVYLMDIPEDWFTNVGFHEDGEGYKANFSIDGQKYWDEYKNSEFVESITSSLGADITINSYDIIMHFDSNATITQIDQSLEIAVTIAGVTCTDNLEQTLRITNVGGVTKFDAPEDGDSFTDITAQLKSYLGITDTTTDDTQTDTDVVAENSTQS